MPVPVTGTLSGVALLAILTVPDVVPAAPGEKRTVSATEFPGVTVAGSAGPLMLSPVPVMVVCEMIKLAFPESLSVSVWVFDTPTGTLPKATLDGTAEICGAMPTPLKATVKFGLLAVLVTVTVPAAEPMAVGVNVTFKETWLPVAKLRGTVIPLAEKPVPVTATFEIETVPLAVLVKVTVCEALLPTFTFPRFRFTELDVRPGAVFGVKTTSRKKFEASKVETGKRPGGPITPLLPTILLSSWLTILVARPLRVVT